MTKFAFTRRQVVIRTVWFDAENEQEAWARALDGGLSCKIKECRDAETKPTFKRAPEADEHDL